ncbi:MAG: sulfite exporter TauE/SafE family protein [Arenimonas sp.]
MSIFEIYLAALFFVVAILYSSVGHAGASGYIAAMALLGMAPEQMRPTALTLNILVGSIGLFRFYRAGLIDYKKVLPFVLASAPCAFFAAKYPIAKEHYSLLLGLFLIFAALAVFKTALSLSKQESEFPLRPIFWPAAVIVGAAIGVLSGLTGTGGAIFLTPILLLAHWAHTREASGISVAFVFINSLTALAGLWKGGASFPDALPYWLVAVAAGALIGTQLGIHRLPVRGLRFALSIVLLIAAGKLLLG